MLSIYQITILKQFFSSLKNKIKYNLQNDPRCSICGDDSFSEKGGWCFSCMKEIYSYYN
jgi:hypothetical protein